MKCSRCGMDQHYNRDSSHCRGCGDPVPKTPAISKMEARHQEWVRRITRAVKSREPTEVELRNLGRVPWEAAWRAGREELAADIKARIDLESVK